MVLDFLNILASLGCTGNFVSSVAEEFVDFKTISVVFCNSRNPLFFPSITAAKTA